MHKLEYENIDKKDWFLVSWTLSNKCNYRCSYCPDILHDGSTGHADWEQVKSFIENFEVPGKQICYRISGGEPTYWKHFKDMAKLVSEKEHKFSFLTNASRDPKYFEEIKDYTDGMMISYHPGYASVIDIVAVCRAFLKPVILNLMMVPEAFEDMKVVAEKIYEYTDNVSIHPKVILDKTSGDFVSNNVLDYTEEQKQFIDTWPYYRDVEFYDLHRGDMLLDGQPITANDLILNGKNKFVDWKCWAGMDGINIDMWGDVYRADCQFGGKIGSIKEGYINLPSSPIVCKKNTCSCLSDLYIRKEQ